MEIREVDITAIKPYERNAKKHPDEQVEQIAKSIEKFGWAQPLAVDGDGVVVIGHGRLLAAKKLGLKTVPCVEIDGLTDEEVRMLRLADNKLNESPWDFDLLADELEGLDFGDLDLDFGVDFETDRGGGYELKTCGALFEKFMIPPFSVINTREGHWQARKNFWKYELGLDTGAGRDNNILVGGDGLEELASRIGTRLNGTSQFDPVLCEIVYKWFCMDGGMIYDPFAGGATRGVVATLLGYQYIGIDLRPEQVEADRVEAENLGCSPIWHVDDSLNADKYIEDGSADLIFSCPPYFNLEKYDEDPRDIANMDYEGFKETLDQIIELSLKKLKDDRFAVFVMSNVRDKKGFYRTLVSDTIDSFQKHGAGFYNDIILVEVIATGAVRVGKVFSSGRKVTKCHQNVLVFYKGDPKKIKENFGEIEFADELFEAE